MSCFFFLSLFLFSFLRACALFSSSYLISSHPLSHSSYLILSHPLSHPLFYLTHPISQDSHRHIRRKPFGEVGRCFCLSSSSLYLFTLKLNSTPNTGSTNSTTKSAPKHGSTWISLWLYRRPRSQHQHGRWKRSRLSRMMLPMEMGSWGLGRVGLLLLLRSVLVIFLCTRFQCLSSFFWCLTPN